MPAFEQFETLIRARFEADATGIANDLFAETLQAWEFDDVKIMREIITDAGDSAQYRMNLGASSAAWQGYQGGRLDAFTDGRPDQPIAWILDDQAHHCVTCIEYARNSPYPAPRLPGIPGQAPTICNGSCRCRLVPVEDR